MDFKKILINNKLLVILIISYLITSILLTSILMGVVSSFVSFRTKDKITEFQKDLMRQSYNTAYYALTDIYGDFYYLWSKDEDITNILKKDSISSDDIKIISRILDTAAFRDDLIHSVYLINKKANLVLSNINGSQTMDNFYDKSGIDLFNDFEKYYDSYNQEIFFPRKTSYFLNETSHNKNYISIVYASKDTDGKLNSGIMVNIDQSKLSSLINMGKENSSMVIANSRGKIISDSKDISFGEYLPRGEIYNGIANNPNDEDSFTGDYLGEKSYITYKKANNIGFVFIGVTPYSLLKAEVFEINSVIAGFFIAAMFISLVVSLLSIKKIYEPINTLIKTMKKSPSIENKSNMAEFDFLGEAYNSLILKNKQSYVARIFNGNFDDFATEVIGFIKDKFLAFVIICDDVNFRTPNIMEKLINIIETNTNWFGTITSNEYISCIINENDFDDDKMDFIMEQLVNLQTIILEKLDTTISIGLGTAVNSLDSIKFSHRYAIIAAQYALSIGENQVVSYNEIEDNKVAASLNKDSIADSIEQYILNNFTRQDFTVDEIVGEINLSLGYIRQIFRSEKGFTLNDFIINCRINKAKELLVHTEDTAKDISEAVGYYDNRYFYTIFKKKVGMTTEEFRKSQRGYQDEIEQYS